MTKRETLFSIVMAVFFLVGFFGHVVSSTLPLMISLTPSFLLLFGGVAFLHVILERQRGVLIWSALLFLVTFALEAVGTATGWIFGPYTYGESLGVKLFGVPLIIAFNWVLVILASLTLALRISHRPLIVSLIVGAAASLFDFVMEPTAVRLSYWTWHTARIPLQNYLAWFLIASAAAYSFIRLNLKIGTPVPMSYVFIQFLFFMGLRFALQ